MSVLNKHRVAVPTALLVGVLMNTGCAAPARSPSTISPIDRGASCDVNLEPQLLELRRENLILSAELRYQQQAFFTLQQKIDAIQHPAAKPAALERSQSAEAEQADNPIFILGRQLALPVAIYSTLRAVRSLVKP